MWKLSLIKDKFENLYNQYGETAVMLRDATCDQPWGPTTEELKNLNSISFKYDQFHDLMKTIWERIQYQKSSWRNIYKTLLVLDYLVKNGSERVIDDAKQNIYILESLKARDYDDDEKKEHKTSITHRASEIIATLQDPKRLEFERKKAKEYNDRMKGIGSSGQSSFGGSPKNQEAIRSTNSYSSNSYKNSYDNSRYNKEYEDSYNSKKLDISPDLCIKAEEIIKKPKETDLVDLMSFSSAENISKPKTADDLFDIFDPMNAPMNNAQKSSLPAPGYNQNQFGQQGMGMFQERSINSDLSFLASSNMTMQPNNMMNQFYQPNQMGFQPMQQNFGMPMMQNQMSMQPRFMGSNQNQFYQGFQQSNNPDSISNMNMMGSVPHQVKPKEEKGLDMLMNENMLFGRVEQPGSKNDSKNTGFPFDNFSHY